jgi:hypothetical protein
MKADNQQICDGTANAIRLSSIEKALSLICLATAREDREIAAGFASDVLSEVLGRAPQGCLLVTAQHNLNVIAVAAYTDIAGIIVTSGYRPTDEVLARARAEGIALYSTQAQTFDVVGKLSRLGIQGPSKKQQDAVGAAAPTAPKSGSFQD